MVWWSLCFDRSLHRTIKSTVGLKKTAPELTSLLEEGSVFQAEGCKPAILKQMITRYYRFIQLKTSYQYILLVRMIDIEIIRQIHLFWLALYRTDCLRLFHQVIDHSLLTNDIEQLLKEQTLIDTCQLYEQRFDEQYCSLSSSAEKIERWVFSERLNELWEYNW
jgi:hypothetical protein